MPNWDTTTTDDVEDSGLDATKMVGVDAAGDPIFVPAAPVIARAVAHVENRAVQATSEAVATANAASAAMVATLREEVINTFLAVLNSAPDSGNATLQVVDGVLQWVMAGAPTLDTAATSSGTTTVGQTLTGVPAEFTSDTSVANLWLYSDLSSTGVTTTTYVQTSADLGKSLVFQSTGINASGSTISRAPALGPVVATSETEFGINGLASGITATADTVNGLQPAPNPLESGAVYENSVNTVRVAGGGFRAKNLAEFSYCSIDAGSPTDVIHEVTFTPASSSLFLDVSWCGSGNANFPYGTHTGYTLRLYRASTAAAWTVALYRNPGGGVDPVDLFTEIPSSFAAGVTTFVVTVEATASGIEGTIAADGGTAVVYTSSNTTHRGNHLLTLSKADTGTAALITTKFGATGSTPPPDPGAEDVDTVLWTEPLDSTDTALVNRNYILPVIKSAYDPYPTIKSGYTAGMAYTVQARFDNESSGVSKYQSGESKIGAAVWPVEMRAGITPPVLRHTGTKSCYFYIDAAANGFLTNTSSKAEFHDRKLLIAQGMAEEQTLWFGWSEYWTHIDTGAGSSTMQFRDLVTGHVNTQGSNWLGELGINVATEAAARGLTEAQVAANIQGTGPCCALQMNPSGGRGHMSVEIRSGSCWTHQPIQWSVNKQWTRSQPTDLNVWYDIVIRFKSSQGSTGRFAIWVRKVTGGVQESPMVVSTPDFEHLGPTEYTYPTVQGIRIKAYPEIRKGLYRFRRQAAQPGGVAFPHNTSDPNRYMAKYEGPWRTWIGDSDAGLALVNPNQTP